MTENARIDALPSNSAIACGQCGSSRLLQALQEDVFTYGSDAKATQLSVQVPVYSCEECGFRFTAESAEHLRHEAVCRHLGVLTPREIRSIRSQLGMTRERFADLTGIGNASLARWETGELIQGAGYDRYLRLLRYPENIERLGRTAQRMDAPKSAVAPVGVPTPKKPAFRALLAAGRYQDHVIAASVFSLVQVSVARPH